MGNPIIGATFILAFLVFLGLATAFKKSRLVWGLGSFATLVLAVVSFATPVFQTQTFIQNDGVLTSGDQTGGGGLTITTTDKNDPRQLATVRSVARNVLSQTALYLAGTAVLLRGDNTEITTGTMTGGTAKTYLSSTSIDRYINGKFVMLSGANPGSTGGGQTGFVGGSMPFNTDPTSVELTLETSNSSTPAGFWRTSAFANTTRAHLDPQTSDLSLVPVTESTALGIGASLALKFQFSQNNTVTGFGADRYIKAPLPFTDKEVYDQDNDGFPDGGILVGVDLNVGEISTNGFSLSGGTFDFTPKLLSRCPTDATSGTFTPDVCYILRGSKSTDGLKTFDINVNGDVAEPTADVVIFFRDIVPFRDIDGVIKVGVANSGRTDQGSTDLNATINLT